MIGFLVRHRIGVLSVLIVVVVWEIAGHVSPHSPLRESPVVPPLEFIFGPALIGMADYWRIDWLAPTPIDGGERTLLGAVLALSYHTVLTLSRLVVGLVLGAVIGVALGLAISWSRVAREMFAAPLHIFRMLPLLAMVPLFQFWFGATNLSAIVFVAYGVGVVYLAGTVNAVANIQARYYEYAATLGASKARIYASVVLPAILPELFSSVMLTLGLAWSAVIGAEYIGVDSGIGRMIIWAEFFSHTGRIALVTILLTVYAAASFLVFRGVARRLLSWMPSGDPTRP
ncbi:MAG: ABC transporter permease subunit [Azospirillaceae bacterium]